MHTDTISESTKSQSRSDALCLVLFLMWARDEAQALGDDSVTGHILAASLRLRELYGLTEKELFLQIAVEKEKCEQANATLKTGLSRSQKNKTR